MTNLVHASKSVTKQSLSTDTQEYEKFKILHLLFYFKTSLQKWFKIQYKILPIPSYIHPTICSIFFNGQTSLDSGNF